MPVRVLYIGNFEPPNSTENDLKWTLEDMGHTVIPVQEQVLASWQEALDRLIDVDMVMWTRTASLAAQIPEETQRLLQFTARSKGVPTVGYHLDRWWGLERWKQVLSEPWFRCDLVFTADGAHNKQWRQADVNHRWMPPAICKRKAFRGSFNEEYARAVAFVGSWRAGYHPEWQHRAQLIDYLRQNLGRKVGLFPLREGDPRIDGPDRADLFASVKVVIGDSCLTPTVDGLPMHHYCSDRVFETIGQGGLLLHPRVDGIIGPANGDNLLVENTHCLAWGLDDWAELAQKITLAINPNRDAQAEAIRTAGFDYVVANHTYHNRLQAMLDIVLPDAS